MTEHGVSICAEISCKIGPVATRLSGSLKVIESDRSVVHDFLSVIVTMSLSRTASEDIR